MRDVIKSETSGVEEKILKEIDLLQSANNIKLIKCIPNTNKNGLFLDLSIKDFFAFCRENGINTIFYSYKFYDIDKFLITDELIKDNTFSKEEFKICKAKSEERNREIKSFNFDEPLSLTMTGIYNGILVNCFSYNEWLKDYQTADDFIIEIAESLEESPAENKSNSEERFSLNEELKMKLLADPEFRLSSNKDLRIHYFKKFIQEKENQKYLSLFRKSKDNYYRGEQLLQLIHQIYAQYKLDCYKNKVHLGDVLPENND